MTLTQTQSQHALNLNLETSAVLFLIHGTRNPKAVETIRRDMDAMCESYAETVALPVNWVRYCFLEFLEPSLKDALETLCKEGRTELFLVPLLLFPGTHLYQDVPEVTDVIKVDYPNVNIHIGNAIGVLEPEFASILSKRIVESTH